MEFYQVHYGGGFEDNWENVSNLYRCEENAKDFIKQLGFKWVTHSNGREDWEQQNDEYVEPYWAEVSVVKVVD